MTITNECEKEIMKICPPQNNEVSGCIHTVVEFGEFNVAIISKDKFNCMIVEYRQQALQCIFTEDKNKWYQKTEIEIPKQLDFSLLKRTIFWESKNRISTAARKWNKQEIKAAKKEFVHSIRYFYFALQIATERKIKDFQIANSIWQFVQNLPENTDWKIFLEGWNFVCIQFKEILKKIISSYPTKIKNDVDLSEISDQLIQISICQL